MKSAREEGIGIYQVNIEGIHQRGNSPTEKTDLSRGTQRGEKPIYVHKAEKSEK